MFSFLKMDKSTAVKVLVFLIAWINPVLVAHGYQPFSIDSNVLAIVVAFVVSVWTFVSHNFFGHRGLKQKQALKELALKSQGIVKK